MTGPASKQLRLAVVCDYPEENWPSMDLCAQMLLDHLPNVAGAAVQARKVCPPFLRRFGRVPLLGRRRWAFNADRLLNRFWYYPRYLGGRRPDCDVFHLCDHSYAQLVHALPQRQTGIFCQDLDTFRCLLEPRAEPRPRWFRFMMRRTLSGLQKAAVVFHATRAVRQQIEKHGLVDPARLVHAPHGIAAEFTPQAEEPVPLPPRLALPGPYLLHVGSCIPRKRIDVLLEVFGTARAEFPDLRLVQVGGEWTPAQAQQLAQRGLTQATCQVRGLDRRTLAEVYRRAAVVMLPSEGEGFGLPVAEALACGAVVLASDIPVLREVGGPAAVYRPVGDVARWVEAVATLLRDPAVAPERSLRLVQARQYSWAAQAETIVNAYTRLAF